MIYREFLGVWVEFKYVDGAVDSLTKGFFIVKSAFSLCCKIVNLHYFEQPFLLQDILPSDGFLQSPSESYSLQSPVVCRFLKFYKWLSVWFYKRKRDCLHCWVMSWSAASNDSIENSVQWTAMMNWINKSTEIYLDTREL